MSILNRLFGGWLRQPPPDEPSLRDVVITQELHHSWAELEAFTQSLLASLPEEEQSRLVQRVMRVYVQGEKPTSALTEGLLDADKGQSLEHLALLAVDWRGVDDFGYFAPYLVKACGIQELYPYEQSQAQTVVEVQAEFDDWLTKFGKRYLHLNTGGDEHVGFIVDADCVDIMVEKARKAGIEVRIEAF